MFPDAKGHKVGCIEGFDVRQISPIKVHRCDLSLSIFQESGLVWHRHSCLCLRPSCFNQAQAGVPVPQNQYCLSFRSIRNVGRSFEPSPDTYH